MRSNETIPSLRDRSRQLCAPLICLLITAAWGAVAAEPKRKSIPIGGQWNLSGLALDRTEVDGKRVIRLIAHGDAHLKRGRNPLVGPWTLEATADRIECDFPGKKFILGGPCAVTEKQPAGRSKVVEGIDATSRIELDFQTGELHGTGPIRERTLDLPAQAKGANGG